MKRPANPCDPDCPRRTTTCKFDGSCGRYAACAKNQDAYRNEVRTHAASIAAADDITHRAIRKCGGYRER